MSQIVEKVHNFLDFFEFGKKLIFDDPPPRPKLGKIGNVDYFDIVAPPLTLAKTVPKTYQTDTWGLFYSYIGFSFMIQIFHISGQYQSHIS